MVTFYGYERSHTGTPDVAVQFLRWKRWRVYIVRRGRRTGPWRRVKARRYGRSYHVTYQAMNGRRRTVKYRYW